jgi:phage anti-repressor protein
MGYVIHDLQYDTWYCGKRYSNTGFSSNYDYAYVFKSWNEAEAALHALKKLPNNIGCIIEKI